jgi:hypothetical protein
MFRSYYVFLISCMKLRFNEPSLSAPRLAIECQYQDRPQIAQILTSCVRHVLQYAF